MNRKIVFILGTGHCGSTLLDMILSSHSEAFGLGEIRTLSQRRHYLDYEFPLSNLHGFDDTFWTREVVTEMRPLFRGDRSRFFRLLYRLVPALNGDRRRLYQYLFGRSGARVLVDSSTGVGWFRQYLRQARGEAEPVAVWIERDPRAVVASYRRKRPDRSVEQLAEQLRAEVQGLASFYESFAGTKARVRYEELAADTERVIRELCARIGLEFEPEMLEYWRFEHHHIAGNAGTKSLIRKFQGGDGQALLDPRFNFMKDANKDYYREHGLAIQVDERWTRELTPDEASSIERIVNGR
jgi:hypothetical protein